jgi:hypothetical protein
MADVIARCLKCKKNIVVQNPEQTEVRPGVNAVRGTCPDCKGKVYRIIGKKTLAEIQKE